MTAPTLYTTKLPFSSLLPGISPAATVERVPTPNLLGVLAEKTEMQAWHGKARRNDLTGDRVMAGESGELLNELWPD